MDNISDFSFWRDVAAVLGIVASIVLSFTIINGKFFSPWIAKPLVKAVKQEVSDIVQLELATPKVLDRWKLVLLEAIKENNSEMEDELKVELNKVLGALKRLGSRVTKIEQQMRADADKLDAANLLVDSMDVHASRGGNRNARRNP
jgi:uncharacterized iron-regulated membrane protein